jgi:hypothetical protein
MIQGKPGLIGSVISTNPTASSSSQTVSVRAALKGQTNQVRFGEYLKVNLPVSTTPGGWDLPLSALAYKNSQAYVFVRTTKGFGSFDLTTVEQQVHTRKSRLKEIYNHQIKLQLVV